MRSRCHVLPPQDLAGRSYLQIVESRRDVKRFLTKMQKCQANPLLVVTGGIHMHTIRVPDEEALAAIRTDLKRLGILVDESCK